MATITVSKQLGSLGEEIASVVSFPRNDTAALSLKAKGAPSLLPLK